MAKEEAKSQTNDRTATARCAAECSVPASKAGARAGGVISKENPSTAGTMRFGNQPHRRGVCTGASRLTGLFPV